MDNSSGGESNAAELPEERTVWSAGAFRKSIDAGSTPLGVRWCAMCNAVISVS
jgi:hypothetical protein